MSTALLFVPVMVVNGLRSGAALGLASSNNPLDGAASISTEVAVNA